MLRNYASTYMPEIWMRQKSRIEAVQEKVRNHAKNWHEKSPVSRAFPRKVGLAAPNFSVSGWAGISLRAFQRLVGFTRGERSVSL